MAELQEPLYLENGSAHTAAGMRLAHTSLVATEGVVDKAGGDLEVTEKSGTADMSVDVAAGAAFIDGDENAHQGTYHVYNDATVNLAIAAADATNPRKDLVVAKVQDSQYSGATDSWSLAVVTGTAAASPSEPTAPDNSITLALVDVAASASSILDANITDRRAQAETPPQTLPVVRGSASAGSSAMSTTEQTKVSVVLDIPTSWNTYDVDAWGSMYAQDSGAAGSASITLRLRLQGTAMGQVAEEIQTSNLDDVESLAVVGSIGPQSPTGSRTVALSTQLSAESGGFTGAEFRVTAYAWRVS